MITRVKKIEVLCTDADGVLNDLEAFQRWMIVDYYRQTGKPMPKVINPNGYDVTKMYEIGKLRRNIIWLQYFKQYCLEHPARPKTFETLKKIQSMGIQVPIVTSRAFVTTPILKHTARDWFEEWLELNEFEPDGIDYCVEKGSGPAKAAAVQKRKGDLMIDDKNDNFDAILEVCDTVGFPAMYNRDYVPENKPHDFYWAPNYWEDVEEIVMKRNG